MPENVHEVFAIRYATVNRKSSENFLDGDPHESAGSMDYFVWLIRSGDNLVLVDTGFNKEAAVQRGRTFLRCPVNSLSLLNISPTDIKDVVLTHLHYDHAGNCDLLPDARFFVQADEMQYATGPYMRHSVLRKAYHVDDVLDMVSAVYDGRVVMLNGSKEIRPGIIVHRVGGHTAGLQIVQVWTDKGWLVLASDATHFYANFQESRPFPIVHHVGEMLDAYDVITELASAPELVVPGHDPMVMDKFSAPSIETEGVVVRLA
ncbi:N-acyl homoserine lactonase family protein [Marinobacter sp. GN3S48]|uniref:N-acyl homoserine lactonase family protein n=1 Tax=Marinobacter sp. GN3S48 TaxID=3382302 RepID=UPI00387B09CD